MLCPSPLQLSATHRVPMVRVSVWPTTHAAVLLGTLGTRALNKVNYTAHVLYVYHLAFMPCTSVQVLVGMYSICTAYWHTNSTDLFSSDFQSCAVNVCQNGGTCTQSVDLVICDCPEGFAGKQCQTGDTRSTHTAYTLHECSTVLKARWKPVQHTSHAQRAQLYSLHIENTEFSEIHGTDI